VRITETISFLEFFLVLIGAVGIAVSVLMLAVLWRDRGVLKSAGQNGIDRRLVMGNLRTATGCLFIIVVFTVVGVYGMFIPESPRQVTRTQYEIIAWALILIDVGAVVTVLMDYVDRHRNMADLENRQARRLRQQERIGEADYTPPPSTEPTTTPTTTTGPIVIINGTTKSEGATDG
jgi:hypothetical protein